jgi:hypothetical protein
VRDLVGPELPRGVTRTGDGGLWVAGPAAHGAIETAVAVGVVLVGTLLGAVGAVLTWLLGTHGPGTTFLVLGPLLVVGAAAGGTAARRGRRREGWALGPTGLTLHRARVSEHVPWEEVDTLTLWDRHVRTSNARHGSRRLRLVSVLVTDPAGRRRLELPSENDDRRLRMVIAAARELGLVPGHVGTDRQVG